MSIMNMPPLPFLARLPSVDISLLEAAYTDPRVWDDFDPSLITLASPDPQAFRPPDEPANVLQVGLPTNFKVARFEADEHTALLQSLQRDIQNIRYTINGELFEIILFPHNMFTRVCDETPVSNDTVVALSFNAGASCERVCMRSPPRSTREI